MLIKKSLCAVSTATCREARGPRACVQHLRFYQAHQQKCVLLRFCRTLLYVCCYDLKLWELDRLWDCWWVGDKTERKKYKKQSGGK